MADHDILAAPQHPHLPGWVRKAFLEARMPLTQSLTQLRGEQKEELQQQTQEIAAEISSGKFSAAWKYPDLVAAAKKTCEEQRQAAMKEERARRAAETQRRNLINQLRGAGDVLSSDAMAKLQRAVKGAGDQEALTAVAEQIQQTVANANAMSEKRRVRELERVRTRISHTSGRANRDAPPQESWQDALRRLTGH